ncbi:MAG: helix-turn-helix domain-containing protein [Chitinispirillia bacterium]|nr:helix-turn-helix domain-containing protein [Chitinispirillia bacterium]
MSYEAFCRYERDEREPNILTLITLSKALNVTVDALLGLKPPSDLLAQNSDESAVLRTFRGMSAAWQDRVLELISWLSDAPRLAEASRRSPGGRARA